MIKFLDILREETFNQLYDKKNRWIQMLDAGQRKEIADNLFVLVQNSYAPLGGHPSVPNVDSVFNPRLYYWEAIDHDIDPEADSVLFGRKSPFGIKISGIGHDNQRESKKELIQKLSNQLKKKGYWIEASDRLGDILYGMGTPYIDNQEQVEKIFNQEVEWLDNKGEYKREVSSGNFHVETVFGNPII